MANKTHLTAEILVDEMGKVIDNARITNDEGTELYGRAAELHEAAGERSASKTTAERNAEQREAAERWAREHPEDGELASDPGVEASTIVAPGIVYDKYTGKTWTLPTDAMADMSALLHHSPYNIKKDPEFHYEFHTLAEYNSMVAQGFVGVTCEELGVQKSVVLPGQTATALDCYYIVEGSDICMKIPKVLGEARLKALGQYCDAAKNGVNKGQITMAAAENIRDSPSSIPLDDPEVPVRGKTSIRTDTHEPTRDEVI